VDPILINPTVANESAALPAFRALAISFRYRRVTEFVQNDEQHVSHDEVHELLRSAADRFLNAGRSARLLAASLILA